MSDWHRVEKRVARPFIEINSLENSLDEASVFIDGCDIMMKQGIVNLEPSQFDDLEISIFPKIKTLDIFEVLGEHASSFSLFFSLRDTVFKNRTLCRSYSLSGDLPEKIDISKKEIAEYSLGRNMEIILFLALNRNLPKMPGWPYQKGTWIAKQVLSIDSIDNQYSNFPLLRMSPEEAEKRTGYSGIIIDIDYIPGQLTEIPEDDSASIPVYIAEELFDKMLEGNNPDLELMLNVKIIASTLEQAKDDIKSIDSVEKGTILYKIMKNMNKNNEMSLDQLKKMLDNPEQLSMAIEHSSNILKKLTRRK